MTKPINFFTKRTREKPCVLREMFCKSEIRRESTQQNPLRHCTLPRPTAPFSTRAIPAAMGVRTYGQGSADPSGKMDEKLKSKNMQKRAVVYVYVIF